MLAPAVFTMFKNNPREMCFQFLNNKRGGLQIENTSKQPEHGANIKQLLKTFLENPAYKFNGSENSEYIAISYSLFAIRGEPLKTNLVSLMQKAIDKLLKDLQDKLGMINFSKESLYRLSIYRHFPKNTKDTEEKLVNSHAVLILAVKKPQSDAAKQAEKKKHS